MSDRLYRTYRAAHEQGFMPIFVDDDFDSRMLVDACVAAGCTCIEYTLRRRDADTMIPWIRENYPDLHLLVGSTLDDEAILAKAKRRYPQLLTLAELDAMDVDGFISMLGFSLGSIRKYAPRRLVAPTAMTVTEAFQQTGAGAHLIKLQGADLSFVRRCRLEAAFDYCPILVTGGMTPQRIPEAIDAGAIAVGSGFDLILKDQPSDISCKEATKHIIPYLEAAQAAQTRQWPKLAAAAGRDRQTWLDALPHHHPF